LPALIVGKRGFDSRSDHQGKHSFSKDLGSDEMRIEIRARNGTEFRDSLRALADSADGVEQILDLLGGQNVKQGF
jgi:hypothetical protein